MSSVIEPLSGLALTGDASGKEFRVHSVRDDLDLSLTGELVQEIGADVSLHNLHILHVFRGRGRSKCALSRMRRPASSMVKE